MMHCIQIHGSCAMRPRGKELFSLPEGVNKSFTVKSSKGLPGREVWLKGKTHSVFRKQ
jgi:hypothetical protein